MIAKQIADALQALTPAFSGFVELSLLIVGAALIALGAWQIYQPAGLIVAGVLLIVGVILRARGSG